MSMTQEASNRLLEAADDESRRPVGGTNAVTGSSSIADGRGRRATRRERRVRVTEVAVAKPAAPIKAAGPILDRGDALNGGTLLLSKSLSSRDALAVCSYLG